jgi:transposase
MAKFKKYDYNQMMMVPVALKDQLMEGTMEYAINEIVDKKIDLSYFLEKYTNDDTGRPAYDPKILLKVILLAYSRGIIGSRRIEKLCHENITFMALTCGQTPDHSTIAYFISSLKKEVLKIFRDILLLCDAMELLGGTHFSLDGLKLPSNASKEWSGTFKDLKKKKGKLEEKLKQVIHEHEKQDTKGDSPEEKRDKQIKRLEKKIQRIEKFLQEEEPKATIPKEMRFSITDFIYDEKNKEYICPNNKVLKRNAHNFPIRNVVYDIYRSKESYCIECKLRLKCLSKKETKQKHLLIALEHVTSVKQDFALIEKMKQKIDTPEGRSKYSQRLAIVEPVFANIRCHKKLDKFTLRSKTKVNVQWLLYAMVHNIEKILHCGMAY